MARPAGSAVVRRVVRTVNADKRLDKKAPKTTRKGK